MPLSLPVSSVPVTLIVHPSAFPAWGESIKRLVSELGYAIATLHGVGVGVGVIVGVTVIVGVFVGVGVLVGVGVIVGVGVYGV